MLTRATIDLSLLGYAVLLGFLLLKRAAQPLPSWLRWISTISCLLCLVHIAMAMHYYHNWSLSDAIDHTAKITEEQVGLKFGGGVYFNFIFAFFWLADVSWCWLAKTSYDNRPKWVTIALHLYLTFIAINGAVVFETGVTRWVGFGVCTAILGLLLWKPRHSPLPPND